MVDETTADVNAGEGTPSASPTLETTNPEAHGGGSPATEGGTSDGKKGDDKRIVDPERLNKLIADSNELKDLKANVARSEEVTNSRLKAAAEALVGSQGSATKSELDALAEEYNVPIDYLKKSNALFAKLVKEEFQAELAPLKQGQEELKYQKQEQALIEKFPEVASMSTEDRAKLRSMAYSKEYITSPLDAVYARFVLDRPEGRPKTFESGGGKSRGGSSEKAISDMTDAEFMEYSNSLENKNK